MADNIVLNPGVGGDTVRADDVGAGIKIPVSKIHIGGDGVDGGPVTTGNPFPISASQLPLPTGAATQTTLAAVLAALPPAPDAFSRMRVSQPAGLFDSMQQYGDNNLVWENSFTGTGAVSNLLNESTVQLTTGGTANGARVIRQTRAYHRYLPGKSQLVFITFAMDGGAVANLRRRVGYFDANNGIFLELSGSALSIVRRTNVTGTPSDAASVSQASWNLDPMNGSGPSGITLDMSKTQILVIDLQWLGVGRVRVGFDIAGVVYYVHEFRNANSLTTVYMTTACLPVRFELENTGVTAGTNTMRHICASVISEGGTEDQTGFQFSSAPFAITPPNVTTRRAVMSIRAKTTGPNAVRNTGQILLRDYELIPNGTNGFLWELVLNATLTGAAFADYNATYSIAQIDTTATTVSGGVVLDSGYVASGTNVRGTSTAGVYRRLPLVYTGLGNVQDTLTLVCTSLSATANPLVTMTWQELL